MSPRLPSSSVIIPTLERDALLLNVLVLLCGVQQHAPDEVIVVDQTPREMRNPLIRKDIATATRGGNLVWVDQPRAGLTAARNVGLKIATGDVLVYIDDDVILGPDFVGSHLVNYLDPAVHCVTGTVLCGTQPLSVPLDGDIDRSELGFLKDRCAYDRRILDFNRVAGGNFSIRRAALERIGGFDENFLGACHREDIDLAFRLRNAGVGIVFDPRPWAYHLHLNSGGGRSAQLHRTGSLAYNATYFAFRHLRGRYFAEFMWRTVVRSCVLNRTALRTPWTLPASAWALAAGIRSARRVAAQGPRLFAAPDASCCGDDSRGQRD